MTTLVKSISALFLTLSCVSFASDLSLITEKGFKLRASYYQAAENKVNNGDRAVLMLHQCNYN